MSDIDRNVREVTLSGVASSLSRLYHERQTLTERLGERDRLATLAREEYSMAYQIEYLKAGEERENGRPLAVDTRKAKAFIATHDLRVKAEGLECSVRQTREEIRSVQDGIDAARSAGSLIKAEIDLVKSGVGA